ncbi:hypothetical protein EJB05_28964, partial [Eragrostis curvula]
MAPHTSEAKKAAMSGGEDLISALPDGVAGHIVGFLPVEQAVQTSVLARQWRHVWSSSMRRLRFVSSDGRLESSYNFNKLVYHVLLRRDPSMALDEVEFTGTATRFWHENNIDLNAWIRHALLCRTSLLCVRIPFKCFPRLDGSVALASRYLKRLEISHMFVDGNSGHFSSCPALEDVKMVHCHIRTDRILSQSVKRFCITDSYFCVAIQTRVSVPSATVLQLDYNSIQAPLLDSIPPLERAAVAPRSLLHFCHGEVNGECCGICAKCQGTDDCTGGCLHLGGLASAANLELIADCRTIIFRRDMRWCPTFSRLKTLLMNGWCVAANIDPLVCMLEHSPVLENLTLLLGKGPIRSKDVEEKYGLLDRSPVISDTLKKVVVKCEQRDERVLKIASFFITFDIKITIKVTPAE